MQSIDPNTKQSATENQAGKSDKRSSEAVFIRIMAIKRDKSGAAITMVEVNGVDIPALIDTGATSSMLSEEFVVKNGLKIKDIDSNIQFRSAGKTSLIVLGTVCLKFAIVRTEQVETFYVTRNLAHRILIGGDTG